MAWQIDIWSEVLDEAFCKNGVNATPEQISKIAEDVEAARENWAEFTGELVAQSNFYASRNDEKTRLLAELDYEREKEPCPACKGGTLMVPVMNGQMAPIGSGCHKCDGRGGYNPTKKEEYYAARKRSAT